MKGFFKAAGIIGIIIAIIAVIIGVIKMLKMLLIWTGVIFIVALLSWLLLRHLISKNRGADDDSDEL
jgi:ABC-type multidrug transport system permease subunit